MAHHHHEMHLRRPDGSGRGVKRHVSANVARIFPNDRISTDGAEHQHIWIDALEALDGGPDYADDVFVAIRITNGGIGQDIPFEVDTPVELQGLFIPASEADPGPDDPGLAVMHFVHAPEGFVRYQGVTYERG
ncbi:MAG TPA: hypothetical protein VHB27_17065 [Rhodopila sp.]|uniref:hypothetical protein n=1 Tax=Rhodopila sp. TaxID=2480087 RepID=UPI002CD8AC24|nr:hypothetical protein [Rhodopila sp.]HVY16935.1 hypothetical protein [Rhodopila sp.]